MKNVKAPISFLLCLALSLSLVAQSTERTLVKSFNLKGNNKVVLDLKGEVEVKQWNSDLVRIQININVENISESVLKSLILAGRYNLKETEGENGFVISSSALEKEVSLKGQILKEHLSYTVFAPERVLVQMADESATTLEKTEENSSAL